MDVKGYVSAFRITSFIENILVAETIGTCGSSLILVLRTRAVWQRDTKVSLGLGILFLGQIALWALS